MEANDNDDGKADCRLRPSGGNSLALPRDRLFCSSTSWQPQKGTHAHATSPFLNLVYSSRLRTLLYTPQTTQIQPNAFNQDETPQSLASHSLQKCCGVAPAHGGINNRISKTLPSQRIPSTLPDALVLPPAALSSQRCPLTATPHVQLLLKTPRREPQTHRILGSIDGLGIFPRAMWFLYPGVSLVLFPGL